LKGKQVTNIVLTLTRPNVWKVLTFSMHNIYDRHYNLSYFDFSLENQIEMTHSQEVLHFYIT